MNLRKNNIRFLNKRNFFQFFFLLLLIFINRLAIPGFASLSVSIILLIFFIIFSAINNTILLDKRNLIIYCIMLSLLFLSTSVSMFVSTYNINFLGVFLAFLIYTLILFDFRVKFSKDVVLNVFFCFILIGFFQYFIYQIGGYYLDLSSIINSDLMVQGYNTSDGNDYIKKRINGFVFLEPSFFSQFIALYIILEHFFFGFKRIFRVVASLIVILLAASGTGPMLLLFYGVFYTIIQRNFKIIFMFLIVLLLLPVLISFGSAFAPNFMGYVFQRSGEFGLYGDTSFNYRFTLPYIYGYEFMLHSDYLSLLFGNGPFSTEEINKRYWNSYSNFSTLLVSIFEYGWLFTFSYILYLYRTTSRVFNIELQLSFLFMLFVLSGAFYQSYTIILFWILCKIIDFDVKGRNI